MIKPTDEMVHLAVDKFLNHPELNNIGEIDTAMRETLAAVLAIVDRDRCLERRGHVWHPLDKGSSPAWATGRGGSHPHYCVSCSEDGRASGPGCINCRQTGFDQSPWPDCEQCRFERRLSVTS